MKTKKSKVKTVKFVDSFTIDGKEWNRWGIRFENDDAGYYHTTEKEKPEYFEVGREVEYIYEPPAEGEKVGKVKKPSKGNTSQRYYMSSLSGEEYIETLKMEIRERIKQKVLEGIANVPSFAASYAKDIIASKGDFMKDEVMKDEGLFDKLYDKISGKMYEDFPRVAETIKNIIADFDKTNNDE